MKTKNSISTILQICFKEVFSKWKLRLYVSSLVFIFLVFFSSTPLVSKEFCGVEVGRLLWSQHILSTNYYYEAEFWPGKSVIIVVSGTFVYSRTGRQDAHYRWHPGKNDYHSPCEMHSKHGRKYAFVIDKRCWRPNYGNFNDHTYVYFWTVGRNGKIRLEINDNKYKDNSGTLYVRIYDYP